MNSYHVNLAAGDSLVVTVDAHGFLGGGGGGGGGAAGMYAEPGSKVKQRVTERAEAKAAEEKELFMAIAETLSLHSDYKHPRLVSYLDEQARKYGQFEVWEDAYVHLERRESEDETQ